MDLQELIDREEIRQLTYRYSWAWDTGDLDMLLGIFTEDAVWDESALGVPSAEGHEELTEAFRTYRALMAGGAAHPAMNHMIDFLDRDRAKGSCYFIAAAVAPDGKVEVTGVFEDEYVRTPQGWRISSRIGTPRLPPRGMDALAT